MLESGVPYATKNILTMSFVFKQKSRKSCNFNSTFWMECTYSIQKRQITLVSLGVLRLATQAIYYSIVQQTETNSLVLVLQVHGSCVNCYSQLQGPSFTPNQSAVAVIFSPTEYVHIFTRDETGLVCTVYAYSAGAYTATLLVMVNVMKGVGVHPPPSPAQANFTLMMECTPESSRCYSVYSVFSPIHPWIVSAIDGRAVRIRP